MYKLCKTEDSAVRQRQLEQGLLEVMLTKLYEEISVSDLCMQLQIPRKAFYRYFDGKDGALHALIDHTLMDIDLLPNGVVGGEKGSRDALERFFQFWLRQRPLLEALKRNGLSSLLIQRAIALVEKGIILPGSFTSCVNAQTQNHFNTFCVSGLMSIVLRWHEEDFGESVPQMAQTVARLLTKPLFLVHTQ